MGPCTFVPYYQNVCDRSTQRCPSTLDGRPTIYTLVHSWVVPVTLLAASAYASIYSNLLPANMILTAVGRTHLNWWKSSSEVKSDKSVCICISSVVGVMLGSKVVNEASFLVFCALVRPNCLMRARTKSEMAQTNAVALKLPPCYKFNPASGSIK